MARHSEPFACATARARNATAMTAVFNADEYGFMVDLLDKTARASGVDGKRLDGWVLDQARRIAGDRFFMVMTHFVASATQPRARS